MDINCFDQDITDQYAIYNGDCCELIAKIPEESIGLTVYSPPFCGLYNYSSSDRDLSNNSYEGFFDHYRFLVNHIYRVTQQGRLSCVHVMDVPKGTNRGYTDFPGDVIRLHEEMGFDYWGRHAIWKEPLAVRLRTMAKGLAHKQIVDDSSLVDVASADYLLLFRKRGENLNPIEHPVGLSDYAGERQIPEDLLKYKHWEGKQTENRYSHWIWRQYASAFWDDVRIDRVLPFKESKDPDDEKHVHPLQLDVIERCVTLRTNPGDTVLTPFMGVGSECYGAVDLGRKAIGFELKPSYYKQAVKNLRSLKTKTTETQLF